MGARHLARLVGWLVLCGAIPVAFWTVVPKRSAVVLGVLASLVATGWLLVWLPRAAHAAFEAARYPAALRRYGLLGALSFTRRRSRAAHLSRAACQLAAGRHEAADELLATVEPAELGTSERAVWLNNRATAALDAGREPAAALALVEEAIGLRPDVPALQHTRARALIALGRLDEAIAALESMRAGGELSLRLEAERCRELATAWERKGQRDYADDYRDRARLHAI